MLNLSLLAQSDTDVGVIPMIFGLLIMILVLGSFWVLFAKAGKPGWAAIIPIYNLIVYLQIINKPIWMIILFFIPFVNIIAGLYFNYLFIRAYGNGIVMFILSLFVPFIVYPYLAYGGSKYVGVD